MTSPATADSRPDDALTRRLFLAGLIDVAEDGIVTADGSHRIVLFNRGAERIFGYDRADVLGQSLHVLLPPRYAAAHHGQVDQFARGREMSRSMAERSEVFGRRKDGSEFPADVSISKITADGELFLTAIVRDVTERVRARDAILKLNEDLERRVAERTAELVEAARLLKRKNEENETFVYSVSHDLRSPLVNLQGFSQELRTVGSELRQLLADETVPTQVREQAARLIEQDMGESLGYIEAAVGRLGRIIDALLRLSRAGRVEYQLVRVDVGQLVRRILDASHGTITEKGATVTVATELPPAWGDATALEQVFANLIGNALKYLAPKRPGRIEIGSQPSQGSTTYFVRDNGLGIPTNYLAQLFQAFRRLHPDVAGGEGMGLAIVRRVVERHGGRVWADSQPNEGTTFWVSLPEPGSPV